MTSEGEESKIGFGILHAQVGREFGPVLKETRADQKQKCLLDHLCKQMGYDFAVEFKGSHVVVKGKHSFKLTRISCDDGSEMNSPTFQISKIKSKKPGMDTYVSCGPYAGVCPITERGKFLMRVCFEGFGIEVLQCPFSRTIYTSTIWPPETFAIVSAKCDSDPHFYQGCGLRETFSDTAINDAAICGDFICATRNTSDSALKENIDYIAVSPKYVCNVDKTCVSFHQHESCPLDDLQDCPNQDIPGDFCSSGYKTVQLLSGRIVPKFKVCNGRCDDDYRCEDEALCGGHIYGTYCFGPGEKINLTLNYVKPDETCDGNPSHLCLNGEDEQGCPKVSINDSLNICDLDFRYRPNTIIPLFNRTRCSAPWRELTFSMCSNYLDQTNCSVPARSAVIFEIRGMISNVSKFFVCHDQSGIPALCDNGIDQECSSGKISLTCKLHKHQLCDSINDCPDGSDEKLEICRSMTERTCYRAFKHERSLAIPFFWLRDGMEDCLDSLDEKDVWPSCGVGRTERFVAEDEKSDCGEVFLCSHLQEAFVQFRDLCDGIDSCGNEKRICDKSHLAIPITVDNVVNIKTSDGLRKWLLYCLPGLESLQSLVEKCVRRELNLFGVEVFGVRNAMTIIPDRTMDCDYTFGEMYLILSCSGYCEKSNCPIKNKFRHDSCPGQYPKRVYTLADNKYLTFVTKSGGEFKN